MSRTLHIELSKPEAALTEFANVFRQAAEDEAITPREALGFEDIGAFVATLTPKRWELI